ncbi:MAG TPA: PqqD family protein [Ruania sp.]|nr:PqqD family protein [Ruania sp.]
MKLRDDGIIWQELDGELVMMDLHRSVYLTTNGAGTFLARLLTEERSLEELASALSGEYGIDPGSARTDAGAFVDQLVAKDLLR